MDFLAKLFIKNNINKHKSFVWNAQNKLLDPIKYRTDYDTKGSSNYAFPVILRKKDLNLFNDCCKLLSYEDVEYRVGTAGGGNQARQPYLEKYDFRVHDLDNVNHIHDYGLYVGNYKILPFKYIEKFYLP